MFDNIIIHYLALILFIVLCTYLINRFFKRHTNIIILISIPTLIFIRLVEELIRHKLSAFDSAIYNYLSSFLSPQFTLFMKILSNLASPTILISIVIVFHFVTRLKKLPKIISYIMAVNLAFTWVLNEILKFIFHRQRPDILRLVPARGLSFPSGHAMISMSFYGLFMYFIYKYVKNPLVRGISLFIIALLILMIGLSRIYLGVHYASDVIAGFSAGFAWIVILTAAINKYYINKK